MGDPKIRPDHLERIAYVYVRQSGANQPMNHPESTAVQYRLRKRAEDLGWPPPRISVVDEDLGHSAQVHSERLGFERMVTEVCLRRAGAIFAFQASRLSRNDPDFARLIEICSVTKTLIVDENRVYQPWDHNDCLVLGILGTISVAEVRQMMSCMQAAKRNKAGRGELRFPQAVGYVWDEENETVVMDPDEGVQGTIGDVFRYFRRCGSAHAVVRRFVEEDRLFPKRVYGGPQSGAITWGKPSLGRIAAILRNPRYAGVYVYGRYQVQKVVEEGGKIRNRLVRLPMAEWSVAIRDHHPGYVTWQEYEENVKKLKQNQTNALSIENRGAAREGSALLQGMLICGHCAHRMTIRYTGNGGYYPRYLCEYMRTHYGGKPCQAAPAKILDEAVREALFDAIRPAQLQISLQVQKQMEARRQEEGQAWKLRIERARYDAERAKRQFDRVEPEDRLVARSLEKAWEAKLEQADALEREYESRLARPPLTFTREQEEAIRSLSTEMPRVWNVKTTNDKDRKRLVRLLIRDVTFCRNAESRDATLKILWQTGATSSIQIQLPEPYGKRTKTKPEVVSRLRELAPHHTQSELVEILNKEGFRSGRGKGFTYEMVSWLCYKHRIRTGRGRELEEARKEGTRGDRYSVSASAEALGVSKAMIYNWAHEGLLESQRRGVGYPYWLEIPKGWVRKIASVERSQKREVLRGLRG